MSRARKPMPCTLWDLRFNAKSGYYEMTEDGILYQMEIEETRLVRDYYSDFVPDRKTDTYPTLSQWYKDLPKEIKKRVQRIGEITEEANGFYPDAEYD